MFIRYISHEIRNPLNAVKLGLDLLQTNIRRSCSMTAAEILKDVKQSLDASLVTLDDMLTSDKIRSGFLKLERKLTIISTPVLEAIEAASIQVGNCAMLLLILA